MAGRRRSAGLAALVVLAATLGLATNAFAQDDAGEAPPPVGETGEVRAEIRWTAGYQPVMLVGTGGPPFVPLVQPATSDECFSAVLQSLPPQFVVTCEVPDGVECVDASVEVSQVGSRLGGADALALCGSGDDAAEAGCTFEDEAATSTDIVPGCSDEATGTAEDVFSCYAQPWDPATPYGSVTCQTTYQET